MIDVHRVLIDVPHFDTFCSVEKLNDLVEELRNDARFIVKTEGVSVEGRSIHHVICGKGATKALVVAFPHCKEPIGGLTVFSLLKLLQQGNSSLMDADVEWHVVPCIDPDGAILNEGWSQKPLSLVNYMKNFYVQALRDQVDTSFPLKHKNLTWLDASKEATILRRILDDVRPDFLYSLHNAWIGGAFYFISRDIDHKFHDALYSLLRSQDFPLQKRPIWRDVCKPYGEGIVDSWSIKKHYDHLEKTMSEPQNVLRFGGGSWDYLEEIKPDAIMFMTEVGYLRHPGDESEAETGENLRRFKLKIDAECKYLATVLLEEYEKVKEDLDKSSPLYRAVEGGGVLPTRESLADGGRPMSMHPTQDILFNPAYGKVMKEGDRFQACMVDSGFWFLCHSYQFVRLLEASEQTVAVQSAIGRLERAFDTVLAEIGRYVDLNAFEAFEFDALAKVQLGSGLIVLNSLLERQVSKGAKSDAA